MPDVVESSLEVACEVIGIRTSPTLGALAAALAKAQGVMQPAIKSAENPFFHSNYADLAEVREACRQPLSENGLAIVQLPATTVRGTPEVATIKARSGEERPVVRAATEVRVTTRLLHESGEWIEGTVGAVLPNADPQTVGSATTYLRRYALSAMVGVVSADADDDGEVAVGRTRKRKASGERPAQQYRSDPNDARPITTGEDGKGGQLGRLKAIMRQHGVDGDKEKAFGAWLRTNFSVTRYSEIQRKDYDNIVAAVESGAYLDGAQVR